MMDRRAFITIVGGSMLALPLAGGAQQSPKVWRIGFLSPFSADLDECHESGLLAVGLVTVPPPEPTCSGGPFS